MNTKLPLFCAMAMLACTTAERDNPDDPKSINYKGSSSSNSPLSSATEQGSSSSALPSSSSVAPSSSSAPTQTGVISGPSVPYEGETYETVVIGSQIWFKRNLNYAVAGSKCGNGSSLSDANTGTCDTYGRLYTWATSMALDTSCNRKTCASSVDARHRGICPEDWHIPSDGEWTTLTSFVGTNAGTKLKSVSGWNPDGTPAGTDNYGFAALGGGNGNSLGTFGNVGRYGSWWSATGDDADDANNAYYRIMYYNYEGVSRYGYYKNDLVSVRCVKD